MATGVVIRLKNLPLAAGTIDIRRFFGALRIPDGGVHIIGGNDGTAFILFSTDEDARQAMLQDGQSICGSTIRLMLSSHTEMKTVIEKSQRICEELRGLRPPEPPITNLSSRSNVSGYQHSQQRQQQAKPSSPETKAAVFDVNDVHVEIKGMPFSVTQSDIIYFFSPLPISAIKFMLDEKGRKNGTGFVKFSSAIHKREGLKRDRKYIGSRFVKLTSASERQWLLASSQACDTIRLGSDSTNNRKRGSSVSSPKEGTPKRSRAFSPLRTDNCVEVRGLPSTTTFKLVGDFFARLHFVEGGLFVEMDGKICKGTAYVEFSSYADYKEALSKDGDMLNGKQVRVISLSKQNMIEQIRRHKKYVKSKRDEAINRERLEQEKEKKLFEKKLKEDENLQKKRDHQHRKHREMDEWLRRQHEKEENERKKRDLQKQTQMLSNAGMLKLEEVKTMEKKGLHDIEVEGNLKQEVPKEETKILGQMSKVEDQVLGAGEMDIEEDSNDVNMDNTATNVQTQPALPSVNASTSFGFSSLVGNSGSVITSPVPLNINSALPVINSHFALPNMPYMQSTMPNFSASNLVLSKPSFITTSQPTMLNTPPPPLPPNVLPPPTPPTVLPVNMPGLPKLENQASNPSSNAVTHHVPTQTSVLEVESEYVRVANSPYSVTEKDIRDFFVGLTIPPHGIQFITKTPGNRRSGHVFIKFNSKADAAKAALKHDQKLSGRNVLVKAVTLHHLTQVYEKITKGGVYVPTFDPKPRSSDNDNFFTKRILDDKMTCVCIGNVPAQTSRDDVLKVIGDIKYVKNRIVILRDSIGNCKGDVYVELQNPQECVRAANLHGNKKIRGEIIRVLPLTAHAMQRDIEGRQNKAPSSNQFIPHENNSKSNGYKSMPKDVHNQFSHPPPKGSFNGSNHSNEAFPPPPIFTPFEGIRPPYSPRLPPPNLSGDFYRAPINDNPRKPFSSGDMLLPPRPQTRDENVRMQVPPMLEPFAFPPGPPPSLGTRFPLNRPPPFPINSTFIATIKMSNLSFKVTREDILEFFTGFDPLPDSVRLMYNKTGKPTGDGVVSFPNIDAARAAVDRRNACVLLMRKIKLNLQ